jgi:hypothetical protein
MDGETWYEIRVKSYGMAMRHETPGETILYGPLADQAALHGVLMRIRDLGLELLSVKQSTANSHRPPG